MNSKPNRGTVSRSVHSAGGSVRGIARLQRRIQRQVARSDRRHPPKELKRSMQAGARHYPEPPLPAQHRAKPGQESHIDPAPMYDAPYYQGPGNSMTK